MFVRLVLVMLPLTPLVRSLLEMPCEQFLEVLVWQCFRISSSLCGLLNYLNLSSRSSRLFNMLEILAWFSGGDGKVSGRFSMLGVEELDDTWSKSSLGYCAAPSVGKFKC